MKKLIFAVLAAVMLITVTGCAHAPKNSIYSPEDVYGKKIGVINGTVAASYAPEYGSAYYYNTSDAAIDDLKSGVTDCVVMDEAQAKKAMRRKSGIRTLDDPLIDFGLRCAVAKENADLTEDINSALAGLESDGVLGKITGAYLKGKNYVYMPAEIPQDAPTLTVAVREDFPPYCFTGEDGELTGIDVDIARAICDRLGMNMELITTDGYKIVTAAQYGLAHFAIGGIAASDENREKVDLSEPYAKMTQVVVVRKK